MRILFLLFFSCNAFAATQFICATSSGTGDGSTFANCKAAGTNFANITVSASDLLYICGPTAIRGTLTITTKNNVTIDFGCNGNSSGVITGTDVVSSFAAADGNQEYATTGTFANPLFVLVDGVAWKEGTKGSLADNEWAFNASGGGTAAVFLGSDPGGRTVEIATRSLGLEIVTSTGVTITGGRIYGIRTSGSANGSAAVVCRDSSCTLSGTDFYAVSQSADARNASGSINVSNTSTLLCGDGLDANSGGTLIATNNTISECRWNGFFSRTLTTHGFVPDGEPIGCTDCTAITATSNSIYRSSDAISTRVTNNPTQIIRRNYIEDTVDDGIDLGCTAGTGAVTAEVTGNIIRRVGSNSLQSTGTPWDPSSIGIVWDDRVCGNSSNTTIAHNTIDYSSGGIAFLAAASQSGTINAYKNLIVDINPEQAPTFARYIMNFGGVSATHSLTINSNYNAFYQSIGNGFFTWVSGSSARTYANFSLYQSDSGKDTNSTRTDPKWAGGLIPASSNGFRLLGASGLIKSGVLAQNYQDYAGRFFNNPPSIGAWESASGDDRGTVAARSSVTPRTTVTARTTVAAR